MTTDVEVHPDHVKPEEDVTPENVLDLQAKAQEQNEAMLHQLKLVGKAPSSLFLVNVDLQTLIDFVFAEQDEARAAYECACHLRLNSELKSALHAFATQLVSPTGETLTTDAPPEGV